jgi:hypothetical protein
MASTFRGVQVGKSLVMGLWTPPHAVSRHPREFQAYGRNGVIPERVPGQRAGSRSCEGGDVPVHHLTTAYTPQSASDRGGRTAKNPCHKPAPDGDR